MRTLAGLLLVSVLWMPLLATGQQVVVSGRVIDSETLKPIPFTHIFIVNTSVGATTSDDGNFRLVSENYGEADVVVSFVGYVTYRKHLVYSGEAINLGTIRLKPSETELNEVVVKASRDEAWEKDLKKFKAVFLGKVPFASECTIDNPWVIDLQNDEGSHTLTAKSLAPIMITNKALGYEVNFYLRRMVSNADGYSIEGDSYFTPLKATTQKENDRWNLNREKVYRHSLTNLLRSMLEHTINGESFALYSELSGQGGAFTRMSRFGDNFGKKIRAADTTALVTEQPGTDKFVISFKGRLEAHFHNERSRVKVYQDVDYSISWLTLQSNSIIVNAQGIPTKPTAITVSGAMSDDRVASMLPLDYTPKGDNIKETRQQVVAALPHFYEHIYVHTDRPYYYAGEQLWFKGYVNYQTPSFRDSLSRTVYVDFIGPDKNILSSKILRIDSGRFLGEIDLPIGVDAGTYNLRAYTNLQRNFGDSTLYMKPIPLVEIKDFVERAPADPVQHNGLIVTTAKNKYKSREKIDVQINLTDEEGNPVQGDLSVSVTDMKQVSPVHTSENIVERYPIHELPSVNAATAKHPFVVEYGITINGQFLNNSGKPEKAPVNVVQLNPKDFIMTDSDNEGRFTVNHLMIYDSARFSITASDKKGRTYGKAVLMENSKPPVFYEQLKDSLKVMSSSAVQRDMPGLKQSNDARILEEVVIRGAKTAEEYKADYRVKRPFGKPNYVLTAKDFGNAVYPNVMMMIVGRFPGLIVRQVINPGEPVHWVIYLLKNAARGQQVLVTVNNNFMAGDTPEQVLSAIDPATIESIELKTTMNALYGIASTGGILAIYLKDGSSLSLDPPKSIGTVKARGYTLGPAFPAPDYEAENPSLPDLRSLVYWSPIIPVPASGVATVSFFSADLDTTYRIEIEGVTGDGKPVRVVKMIEVAN